MSHTYTTQDGKTARLVNPYTYPAAPKLHIDFERNNPPIPLTTERPDLIGKEFQGEVVEQGSDDKINWYCEDLGYYQYFRQALSVPVKGEENLPSELLSAGNDNEVSIAAKAAVEGFEKRMLGENHGAYYPGFLDGWNSKEAHATNDANLVPLDKVVEVLEGIKDVWSISAPINDIVTHELNKAITQIKNLTKE